MKKKKVTRNAKIYDYFQFTYFPFLHDLCIICYCLYGFVKHLTGYPKLKVHFPILKPLVLVPENEPLILGC